MKKISTFLGGLLLASIVQAGEPKTFALLEEHQVLGKTSITMGARYSVPAGRKAVVSGLFCDLSSPNWADSGQVSLIVEGPRTIRSSETPWTGMNPISCTNIVGRTSTASGAALTLLPGDWLQVFYQNQGPKPIWVMLGAWILEEDL